MQDIQKNTGTMTKRRQEALTTLNHFYANPVAKVSLELFLSIGLVLILAVFAIQPTINTMSELIAEIEAKEELDEQLSQKAAALQTAQTQYALAQDRLELLDQAIPESAQVIRATKIIEKAASERNVLIRSISVPEIPQENSDLSTGKRVRKSIRMNVSIAGDYPAIRLFAEDIHQARRLLAIESVSFSTQDERGQKSLTATFAIDAPYFGSEQ